MRYSFSPEIADALERGFPVVALESTVISHGLPFPKNLETAQAMESIVREEGAIPATIAVLDGIPSIGLTENQIELLAKADDIRKISIRDIPVAASEGCNGATTVASTMHFAHAAGIRVFATGGIGGIHRGSNTDVSADLPILASTPMTTVCSGAKIVLDIPATREWLETHGVTVLGWDTKHFPAFYSRNSGEFVDASAANAKEAAAVINARDELSLRQAILLTVPVPVDYEIRQNLLEEYLEEALVKAQSGNIVGKEVTPFLLSELGRLSGGKTIESNVSLLLNNARVASLVARALVSN